MPHYTPNALASAWRIGAFKRNNKNYIEIITEGLSQDIIKPSGQIIFDNEKYIVMNCQSSILPTTPGRIIYQIVKEENVRF